MPELEAAIHGYFEQHNEHAQGFTWTATAEEILAKVRRPKAALNKTPSE